MAKVNFKRIENSENINTIDINDGNFIVTGDGKSYIDYGTNRIPTSGTPDTEMSDTSRNTVENKVIKGYVDTISSSHEPFLLWRNPNRNAPFAPQTITLSSEDYDYLEIYYWDWAESDSVGYWDLRSQKVIKYYNALLFTPIMYNGKAYMGVRKMVRETPLKYKVEACYSLINENQIGVKTNNAWCIPVIIYGYKANRTR